MVFATLTVVALLSATVLAGNNQDASKCVAWNRGCDGPLAAGAQNQCRAGIEGNTQNGCCLKAACSYCLNHRHESQCNLPTIDANCYRNNAHHHYCPSGGDSGGGSSSGGSSGGCGGVWQGSGNKVVIGTAGSAQGNWRNTGNGIIYKPWDWNPYGIDGQGSSTLTYKFTVAQSGKYLITMQTRSAHQTEYNDLWIQMPGASLYLAKGYGGWYQGGWLKGYQNRGGLAKELWSKDHDPHAITTGWLNAGQVYSVQVSGRSSQFQLERIMIIQCGGSPCSPWAPEVQPSLYDTNPSNYCS